MQHARTNLSIISPLASCLVLGLTGCGQSIDLASANDPDASSSGAETAIQDAGQNTDSNTDASMDPTTKGPLRLEALPGSPTRINTLHVEGDTLVALPLLNPDIHVSLDRGASWTTTGHHPEDQPTPSRFHGSALEPSELLVATSGHLVLSSNDSGTTWTDFGTIEPRHAAASPGVVRRLSSGSLLAGFLRFYRFTVPEEGGGLFLSDNNGIDWLDISERLPGETDEEGNFVSPSIVGVVEVANDRLVAALRGTSWWVARSEDAGLTWEQVDIPEAVERNGWISDLAQAEDRVFLATEGGLFVSEDQGATFTKQGDGLPDSMVTMVSAEGDNVVVVIFDENDPDFHPAWYSRDGGQTFSQVPLPAETIVTAVTISDGNLFVASYDGIARGAL